MPTAAQQAKKLNVFVPITKVDKEKGIVYGVLAAEEKDRSGEIFDYKGSKPHFEKWSGDIAKVTGGKSVGNLRAMHGAVAAGKFTDIHFNDDDLKIEVAAKIVDKNELEKVLEGVYTGFSIGGAYEKRWKDGDVMRYIANPVEGSLVDLPCIASATFEVVKADGSTELRKFHVPADEPAPEPTNDEIAAEARALAKAAGDETKWLDKLPEATAALKAKKKPPFGKDKKEGDDAEATDEEADDAEKAAGSEDLGASQVWTHADLPGKTFAKKAELRQALVDHRAAAAAAKAAGPVTEAISALRKSLDDKNITVLFEKVGEANYLDVLKGAGIEGDDATAFTAGLAKVGAADAVLFGELAKCEIVVSKEDGKFVEIADPVKVIIQKVLAAAKAEPVVELTAEEKAELLAKGACLPDGSLSIQVRDDFEPALALYDEKPSAVAKRHITKRARALKAIDLLPEDWGIVVDKPLDLKKIAAPELKKAASLYGISSLISMLAQVDACEESLESPGYGYGTMVPKALCDRFGSILVQLGDVVAEVLDTVLSDMKAEEAAEASGGVARAVVAGELLKFAIGEPLVKVGARHSRIDQGRINDAHDLLVDAGAECEAGDYADKTVVVGDLRKTLKAQEKAFSKTLGDLFDLVKDVAGRVKNIEGTPLPEGTTSVDPRFRTVEKGGAEPTTDVRKATYLADPNAAAFATMMGEVNRLGQSGTAQSTR